MLSPREASIAIIQTALEEAGFDPGPADGDLGPKTLEATKAFQTANGLPSTGRLNSATIEKLGVEMGSIFAINELVVV